MDSLFSRVGWGMTAEQKQCSPWYKEITHAYYWAGWPGNKLWQQSEWSFVYIKLRKPGLGDRESVEGIWQETKVDGLKKCYLIDREALKGSAICLCSVWNWLQNYKLEATVTLTVVQVILGIAINSGVANSGNLLIHRQATRTINIAGSDLRFQRRPPRNPEIVNTDLIIPASCTLDILVLFAIHKSSYGKWKEKEEQSKPVWWSQSDVYCDSREGVSVR